MPKLKRKQLILKLDLIRKELPKSRNTPLGVHRVKYYVQYLSLDNYLLAEREATSFDLDLFDEYRTQL